MWGFALLNFVTWYWNMFLNKCGYVIYHFNANFSLYLNPGKPSRVLLQHVSRPDSPTMTREQWRAPPRHSHGDPTSRVPQERLTELGVVPREKPHTGASAREKPRDTPSSRNEPFLSENKVGAQGSKILEDLFFSGLTNGFFGKSEKKT